jgi:hypothetical protein
MRATRHAQIGGGLCCGTRPNQDEKLHTRPMGESATMSLVYQRDVWRVRMVWPKHKPRYFGRFPSEAESQRWLKEHSWMTTSIEKDDEKSDNVEPCL